MPKKTIKKKKSVISVKKNFGERLHPSSPDNYATAKDVKR